ncbi:hypothetical protein GUJ93_ZPchr0028g29038 [Zizania palustris]|uniref:DUF674 family protein n=1 Tax=Zizania palustris TaxID=103762 RepID=A0A8J5UVZ9_ZIZPA|nr:hypothetical protein GUJ93_ZPchr0028g29038 [Zizania palustris]
MSETKVEEPTVAVTLLVDKERSKVLFAESDSDFVDVLFGFLTLPLGTVVRLLDRQFRSDASTRCTRAWWISASTTSNQRHARRCFFDRSMLRRTCVVINSR